nr:MULTISPECIES: SDR family NAD(P)-dependent oxidoreductase [unclassified Mycobacterium]
MTGAGRGIGAGYAIQAAAAGAKVVVNDLGGGIHGESGEAAGKSPAEQVVDTITAAGGEAVANHADIADSDGAAALIEETVQHFGDLDVVINNAGILRDRMLVSMSPEEWDAVVRVHLRGHYATSHHAAAYWRNRSREAGRARDAALIHTTSVSGLHGNVGQFNYSAAKAGIASMAINGHLELNERYQVRSYAIAPSARTRLTLSSPGAADGVAAPEDGFDFFDPANVAPFVLWLATADCPAPSGSVFGVEGDLVRRYQPWTIAATIYNDGKPWSFADLDSAYKPLAEAPSPRGLLEAIELSSAHIAQLAAGGAS